jgi:hypothetical protein
MSPLAQLKAFTQSVYLVIKNRYFDDIDGVDGTTLMQQTIDWTNMFIDELETETNPDGTPLDWKWLWQMGATLGSAVKGAASIPFPTAFNFLLADENRYVQITQDGTAVSNWVVVSPQQISNRTNRITQDMCALVGKTVVFSRAFQDYESGGIITGDVSTAFPRIAFTLAANGTFTVTNVKVLTLVQPKALLVLGVAKNASLPDIVQGGLSPSYAQKYGNLLQGAIARNNAGAVASEAVREDLSSIGGLY